MRNFARIPLCRPPPGKRLSRGAHLGGKHPFRFNKAHLNTLSNFLDVLEFEEGKEDETEYRRIDDLSKYIEVIKLRDNPINQSKYYGYNFENEENFFHPNGELKNLPEQVRQNEGERVKEYLHVPPFVLAKLCEYAFKEILFFLNKKHLKQLSNILNDGESSKNDKYVAMTLIKNAVISAEQNLPGCQDTGTAIILGKKDEGILTTYEHKYLNLGVYNAYRNNNFRYSQLSPLSMFSEANTKNNLPCQIEIYSSVRGGKALGGATYTTSSAPATSTTYTTSSAPATSTTYTTSSAPATSTTCTTSNTPTTCTTSNTPTTYTTSNAYTASNETTTCTASGGPPPKYELIFIAKGGGSANKTFLFQQTKSILNEDKLYDFLLDKIKEIGTSACPPYHLAVVIGGLSAEMNLKMVKLASCRYLDDLKKQGGGYGKAFRDIKSEQIILEKAQGLGIGAQFGGKYFVHDVRVIRLPRHSASCPIGIGVSCSADRQIKCVINRQGVFMEALEHEPIKYLPEITYKDLKRVGGMAAHTGGMAARQGGDQPGENQSGEGLPGEGGVPINLNQPMGSILKCLSEHPVSTLLLLTGKLIVARDTAHKRIVDDFVLNGIPIPEYFKKFPIYYAGPAKTPDNYASGSFGPTTAGRMDAYAEVLMKNEASLISLAKGNRSSVVRNACRKYHGFYLGSIGGPGAILAKKNIKKVEVIDFAELGMEAVHLIDVVDFPAFIVIDDKGNDFYNQWIPS